MGVKSRRSSLDIKTRRSSELPNDFTVEITLGRGSNRPMLGMLKVRPVWNPFPSYRILLWSYFVFVGVLKKWVFVFPIGRPVKRMQLLLIIKQRFELAGVSHEHIVWNSADLPDLSWDSVSIQFGQLHGTEPWITAWKHSYLPFRQKLYQQLVWRVGIQAR